MSRARAPLASIEETAAPRCGDWLLLECIGRGASGEVHRAIHETAGTLAALKIVAPLAGERRVAFRREVDTLERVRHPGVASVLAHGVEEERGWCAMELVEGRTLAESWATDASEIGSAERLRASLRRLQDLCSTLSFLHGEGIVHRDVTPSNVVLRPDGRAVLVDFGFAWHFQAASGRETLSADPSLPGTLAYTAPEQFLDAAVDARADLYAVGCLLYEASTGRPPFVGEPDAVRQQHLETDPAPPSSLAAGLPPALDALVLALLRKEPRRRLGCAAAVATALAPLAGAAPPGLVGRPYLYRPAFVGRNDSLRALAGALRSTASGSGRVVLLRGASGVGKTRFVNEVTRRAASAGFRIVSGECIPVDSDALGRARGAPLHPFRRLLQAVAAWSRETDAATRHRVLASAASLAPFEPALREAGAEALPPLPPQALRERILGDLADVLRGFARARRTLLVIDDLQWADDLTLDLLVSLGERLDESTPLLVLAAYRSDEIGEAELALGAGARVTRLELAPLSPVEVRELVAELLGVTQPPPALLRLLHEGSEGKPFLVSEYLRSAMESGLLVRTKTGEWCPAPASGSEESAYQELPLPVTLRAELDRRLAALDDDARRWLEAGAVLGRDFDAAVAAQLGGLEPDRAADVVSELVRRHVVADTVDGRLRFRHDKLREAAYARTEPARRAALHAAAACAIEHDDRVSTGGEDLLASRAHHWLRSGRDDLARPALEAAGAAALARGAHRDARRLLEQAHEIDRRAPSLAGALERARCLRLLAEASTGAADLGTSRRYAREALAVLGERVPQRTAGWSLLALVELLRQALHLSRAANGAPADAREPLTEASRTSALEAVARYHDSELLPAFASSLRCLNRAEQAHRGELAAQPQAQLGYIAGSAGLHRLARAYFDRATAPGGGVDASVRGAAVYFHAMYATGIGAWERSRALACEAISLLDAVGNGHEAEIARTILANALYYSGRIREAERACHQVLEAAETRWHAQHMGWGLFLAGRSWLALGRTREAAELAERGHACLLRAPDRVSLVMCEGTWARALWATGARDRSLDVLGLLEARTAGAWPIPLVQCLDGYVGLAEVAVAAAAEGRWPHRRAARAVARLARFALLFPVARPAALRCRGLLAAIGTRPARALTLLSRALREAEQLEMPYERARAHEALAARLGTDPGAAHAAAARRLLADLGHLGEADRA